MLTPRFRPVSSRIRSLNRSTAFGAIRRFGMPALVKLNPRNFLAQGRATALFCWFTRSLSLLMMNRVRLSIRMCCEVETEYARSGWFQRLGRGRETEETVDERNLAGDVA